MTDENKPVEGTEGEDSQDKKTPAKPKKAEGVVSMPQETYDNIMSRLESLEGDRDADHPMLGADDDSREFLCKVKTLKDRPISRLHSVKEIGVDDKKDSVMECTAVIVEKDGTEKEVKKVNYLDIIRGGGDEGCKIIKNESEKVSMKGPLVDERLWDDEVGKMVKTGRKVYLAVNSTKNKYLVEWRGEQVWLETLNI